MSDSESKKSDTDGNKSKEEKYQRGHEGYKRWYGEKAKDKEADHSHTGPSHGTGERQYGRGAKGVEFWYGKTSGKLPEDKYEESKEK